MNTDQIELTPEQLIDAIEPLIHAQMNGGEPITPIIWGQPGMGKTMIFETLSKEIKLSNGHVGMKYFDPRVPTMDAIDSKGFPKIDQEMEITKWCPPEIFPIVGKANDTPTMLVWDEINRGPKLVINSLLGVINERRVGTAQISNNCFMLAIANREGDDSGLTTLDKAMTNRLLHLYAKPCLTGFYKWAVQNDIHPMVIAFLRFRPEHFNPAYGDDAKVRRHYEDAKAFPTPRTWVLVHKLLTYATSRNGGTPDKTIMRAHIYGAIGSGVGSEFMSFYEMYHKLPSIDEIIMNPKSSPVPDEVSQLCAVTAALIRRAQDDNVESIIEYISRLDDEYNICAIKDLTAKNREFAKNRSFQQWAIANDNKF